MYLATKSLHLVFVIAWMAAVFYLPRILVNVVEAGNAAAVRDRLALMGRRLYRFGHIMFGLALLTGSPVAHLGIAGGWLHAKLAPVAVLFAFYLWNGRLRRCDASRPWPAVRTPAAPGHELPVLLLLAVVWLVRPSRSEPAARARYRNRHSTGSGQHDDFLPWQ